MNGQSVGYLVVNARYANSAVPINNAYVTVESGDDFFSQSFTVSEGGKTERIALPINTYTVSVFAEGFLGKTFYDIGVNDLTDMLIDAQLFPSYDNADREVQNEQ